MSNTCNITLETLTSLPCGRHHGWIEQANHRGTFDIVWSCLFTVFISTYTILCLNVPAPNDTWWAVARRRLMWMGLGIMGPEIVLTYAAGQWSRAHHSLEAFRASGYTGWTLRHAFFADMGGFQLCAPGSPPFPINAKQLHWLVVNRHVDYPSITAEQIRDRSKQDSVAKVVTGFQISFLIIQLIGRAAQHLSITALELNALGIVVCSLMTSYAWLHKPVDIAAAVPICTSSKMEDITGCATWKNTPLDSVDENGPGWAMNIQPFMGMPVIHPERPIKRIPNDRFPMDAYGNQEYLLCLATIIFAAVHVAGWNYSFPSTTERVLWRTSSMLLFTVTVAFWILETMASWKRLGRWKLLYLSVFRRDRVDEFKHTRAAAVPEIQEPSQLPLPWEFWSILPLALLYGTARCYLIAEGFLELRSAPADAFATVDWTNFWPHV